MSNDFLRRMAEALKTEPVARPVPVATAKARLIAEEVIAARAAEVRLTGAIVFVAPNGQRFIPLQKAGALRNGNELGKGNVFHAVEIEDGQTVGHIWDQKEAICGTYPSIMWSTPQEGDAISCPRCLKKLGRLKP